MKPALVFATLGALAALGIGSLYVRDTATAAEAKQVVAHVQDFCRSHARYPSADELRSQFPDRFPGREWYYWPDPALTSATVQYPMSLPLGSAPGQSKLSEFFPVIYAFVVRNPCADI